MFNPVFIHLITNHFPIFGFLFGAVFLFYGLRRDDRDIRNFSLFILILSTILTALAYFSGHNSEEIVEKISGISHEALETHESIALVPFSLAIIVGVLSVLHFFKSAKFISWIILVLSLLTSATSVATSYFGGEIRHHEELKLNHSIE
ncbi:MAG: DUF2231 domain-containing protein [Candidatus Caldipriscus sp.]|jgi:uncharacterized membrane protein|nr:DUF2231 domain-containing protein [Candidatus Caldipriscus sp.]